MKALFLFPIVAVAMIPCAWGGEVLLSDSFDQAKLEAREGDGKQAKILGFKGNPVWQLKGDDDMSVTWQLPVTKGKGDIEVSCRVLIPPATVIQTFDGEKMPGVRVRLRLTDKNGNSAVSEKVLLPGKEWQEVKEKFEDSGDGPYLVELEMIWFEGKVYVDDFSASVGG